jgi:multidrug efflux pump subunit AcrB
VLDQGSGGEVETGRVAGFAVAAVFAAFLLLQAAFRSWRLAALLGATLPLCLVGGLLAALVDGAELSLGSMLGLLAVFGFATRTNMSLVDHLQSREPRRDESRRALVQRAADDQLAPVAISTVALAALVLPFAVLQPQPGLELLHPMALVVLGGLATSMFVSLFVLPAFYLHLASRAAHDGPMSDEDGQPGGEPEPATGVADDSRRRSELVELGGGATHT